MIEAAARLRDATWGLPLIVLLAGAGLYLTILLRGLQLRSLPRALRLALVERDEPRAEGDVSHFQAMTIALGSALGTGSIVAVPVALAAGGAGALFWMWIAGVLALAIRFAEAALGVRYRETDVRGTKSGGPMHYLENGIRWGGLGRPLALGFAVSAVLAAFGFGNGVQVRTVATAVSGVTGAPLLIVGGATALLGGAAILGGIRAIGRVTGILVPLVVVGYLAGAAAVLAANAAALPDVLRSILHGAFGGRAAAGGVAAWTVGEALRAGIARGTLSGEAGLGTGGIAAAAARTREPVRQALVAMVGTFVDTLIVGTATGLVILTAGGAAGGAASDAFTRVMGAGGAWFVAATLTGFAFAALLAWSYYGERCARYLLGERSVMPFRVLFVGVIPLASVLELGVPWAISDLFRALMALPNLIGIVLLSGVVVREARGWLSRASERAPRAAEAGPLDEERQPANGG